MTGAENTSGPRRTRRDGLRPGRRMAVALATVASAAGLVVAPATARAQVDSGTISTMAGSTQNFKSYGYSGDGGPATSAQLWQPRAVAFDSSGDYFVADTLNERIRKVSAAGVISTVAGNGRQGFSGDGGPATSASFRVPHGVAVDSAGNVFVSDSVNNRIRRIDRSGTITTVIGRGRGFGGDGGPASQALLDDPKTLFMDPHDDLYIVDTGNNRIRRVDRDGTITTVAGNGEKGFSGDGGPATSAALDHPEGVCVDSAGAIYIADTMNQRTRKVSPDGVITTVAGTGAKGNGGDDGPAARATLDDPRGVAVDSAGNVYIGEEKGQKVRRISPDGTITTYVGTGVGGYSGDGGPASSARIRNLRGLVVHGSDLWIADAFNNRIRRVAL